MAPTFLIAKKRSISVCHVQPPSLPPWTTIESVLLNDYLPACNELLFDIRIELREQRGGSLSLVCFRSFEPKAIPPPEADLRRSSTFLRWLLRTHVCIDGLKLQCNWMTAHSRIILEELPENCRLKRLKVECPCGDTVKTDIATLLPRLCCLEELYCYVSPSADILVAAISALLRNTTCPYLARFPCVFRERPAATDIHRRSRRKHDTEVPRTVGKLEYRRATGAPRGVRQSARTIISSKSACPTSLKWTPEARRCWFTVREVTRRNSGLVKRAGAVLQSATLDWHTANALEKVSRRAALVRELAEKEGIAADEVARMLRCRLMSVDGMHDFMRLTGVVKERVTCTPPVDGCSLQLQDLNNDCWRLVRRYLSFDDVKRFTVAKPDNTIAS
ncbi:hypothetical protein MTO96_020450 [Rhipicephalus appendiculatus]